MEFFEALQKDVQARGPQLVTGTGAAAGSGFVTAS